ncbi:hypothetical protein [Stenotrophomonas sp. 278]|uniref:hypothetical protein n=1 Tax=Stenotrophomonas sp. 278 TaxID=2479851 RepID=UPI000F6746C1|nr:hypothetical protein [Stenotrophomonas sp. 278]
MSELIQFQGRMRFTALHSYSATGGIGGVAAVFFTPVGHKAKHVSAPPTNEAVALRFVVGHGLATTGPR